MQMSQVTKGVIYDFKEMREKFKKRFGHYPPTLKAVQKAHDEARKARRKAYKEGEPYRNKKREYEMFADLCKFHGVER